MENYVETRLILIDYVYKFSTLIGYIISKLTNDAESDINVNLFRIAKFHDKSRFRTVYVLWTKNTFRRYEMRNDKEPNFSMFWVTAPWK